MHRFAVGGGGLGYPVIVIGGSHLMRIAVLQNPTDTIDKHRRVLLKDRCFALFAGQVGISGSTKLGENVIAGGQVGLVGHIEIGDRVIMGAQAGITKSIPADTTVSGYPAREHGLARKIYVYTARLPELFDRVKDLERRLAKLVGNNDEEKSEHDR